MARPLPIRMAAVLLVVAPAASRAQQPLPLPPAPQAVAMPGPNVWGGTPVVQPYAAYPGYADAPAPWGVMPVAPLTPPAAPADPEDRDRLEHGVGVDLLLGLPSGVRLDFPLGGGHHHYWQAEAFVGGYAVVTLDGVVGVGAAGAGIRPVFELTRDGSNGALLIGPGVMGLVAFAKNSAGMVGPDVTLGLVYGRHSSVAVEVGLDLGVMEVFDARDNIAIPWVALYTGLHF